MIQRILLLGALAAITASAGCRGVCRTNALCPLGAGCDPTYCEEPCWPARGAACQTACEEPCEPACGPESCPPSGPVCGPHFGPLTWFFSVFQFRLCQGHAGCGEMYMGDWCSEPPYCCEPCDRCGNWTGGSGQGSGYSSMYPGGGYGASGEYASAEEGEAAVAAPAPSPGCKNCGQTHAMTPGRSRVAAQYDAGVTPAAAYQPMAQRPSQPYRTPVRRY